MVKDRINEIVDFALTESPSKATSKGWVNDFIYFQLWPSNKATLKENEKLANISLHWNRTYAIILFAIAFVPSLLILSLFTFF